MAAALNLHVEVNFVICLNHLILNGQTFQRSVKLTLGGRGVKTPL